MFINIGGKRIQPSRIDYFCRNQSNHSYTEIHFAGNFDQTLLLYVPIEEVEAALRKHRVTVDGILSTPVQVPRGKNVHE
jgi:hypothetical protein